MKLDIWMKAALTACLLTFVTPPVHAQTAPTPAATSPLMQHYRAYVSARAGKDYKRAETEAVAALAAAEAAGDARVAVLAYNLATLRAFELGDLVGGGAAAEKALAANGGGISPGAARVLVQLSQLPREQDRVRRALNDTMVAARADETADVDFLYRVARAWGLAALSASREESALEAFTHARDLANRMTGDAALDRAFALVEMGALLIVTDREFRAYELFSEAANLLAPLAPESVGETVPAAEMLYAQALTWRGAAYAKAAPYRPERMNIQIAPRSDAPGRPALCEGELLSEPKPKFPPPAIDRLGIGAVMVRLSIGPDGNVRRVQVIGAVPKQDFSAAVLAVAHRWRFVWQESSPGCRRDTDDMLVPIRFMFSS